MTARLLKRFGQSRRGVGAVEFALVMPFLLLLYLAASELTLGITAERKVENASATISDLVAQQTQVSVAQLNLFMGLSDALMAPFDASDLTITVTSVGIDANRNATVDWSSDPVRYRRNRPFAGLPAGIANQTGRHIIVVESSYRYRPVTGFGPLGTFDLTRIAYNQPRSNRPMIGCTDCR